ncbi:MAG: O-succinylbenzoic acid--CoA ligase [Hydrogenibacillus schlegelii]|uniref:O-succinylbenzoic acid--CoA ligase n=2 Tax=Hydrogenibacillus schlegelii TaxID=1484 RepID=A0A2T5GE26_HYDSH|nr:MAG: O-succinylbenzoic acid--CoA ligase [Hydrogenibacillus schlegelii]
MNLGYLLSRSADAYPEHPAIVYGQRVLTYRELNARVNRLVRAFLELGLKPGDRVAILSTNRPEILETLFAAWKAGLIAVPMNFRLHRDEVRYILNDSEAKILVYAGIYQKDIDQIAPDLTATRIFVCLDGPVETEKQNVLSPVDYEELLTSGDEAERMVPVDGDDLAWLFYTSGTTGRPKGAMLTHRILLLAAMNACADVYPFSHRDIALHAAPLTHGSGIYALPLIAKGSTNVILDAPRFDPEAVFALIEKHRVTVLPFLAPTMVKRLIESEARAKHDWSSLRCIIYGGAPMYVEDLVAGLKVFGPILAQVYGQGECPMTITGLAREEHDLNLPERLASAGTARMGVEVRIQDAEGNVLPRGAVGEIAVRSDMVMKGYWRNPEATAETIVDGWLKTGDVGYLDAHGYLYILDRTKDMIISGGNNIYPREVEEVMLRHPAVQEVCVFGVPDPEWGEAVKAVVVLKPGHAATEEELIAFCREHLASYKKPRSVEFVEELPKNAYGKVLKRELRDRYWKGRLRNV